jgi:SAM-dependent methyltransferase
MKFREKINKALIQITGYQLARPEHTIHHEGVLKRQFINDFVLHAHPYGKILDIGANPRSLAKITFEKVVTFDQFAGANVDVVGNLQKLSDSFPENTFDTIICTEVFEHTKEPWIAIEEIEKVLKPGGLFIGSAPLINELHGEDYGDYWRITPQGWQLLLKNFENVHIQSKGIRPQIDHVGATGTKKNKYV